MFMSMNLSGACNRFTTTRIKSRSVLVCLWLVIPVENPASPGLSGFGERSLLWFPVIHGAGEARRALTMSVRSGTDYYS